MEETIQQCKILDIIRRNYHYLNHGYRSINCAYKALTNDAMEQIITHGHLVFGVQSHFS